MKKATYLPFLPTPLACSLAVLTFVFLPAKLQGEHWPQWRGPNANGVVSGSNPPATWSETENIKWKVAIPGKGHASPVIWGNQIFIQTAIAEEADDTANDRELNAAPSRRGQDGPPPGDPGRRGPRGRGRFGGGPQVSNPVEFKLICLDRISGAVIWEKTCRKEIPHEGHHQTNTYSSGSPVTDGQHVYAYFGSRGLYCLDMAGNLVWEKDFGDMRTRNGFGEGSSPVLAGDKLIVLWDTEEESFIAALEKTSGDVIWKTSRDEPTGWTTPYIADYQGEQQVVVNGSNAVRSYDVKTGDLIWECAGQTVNAIPTVVSDETTIYAMSGYRGNTAVAIKLGGKGDLTDSEYVRWKVDRGTPYVPSPLLIDGFLLFCQRNNAILTCVNAETGEPYYTQERVEGISGVYASPVAAGGRIYIPGQEGTTLVLDQSSELKVVAVNKLNDPIDASIAVVKDDLFIRTHTHLYCISAD